MSLHILGLNHNTAPIDIREQVVFDNDEAKRVLTEVTKLQGTTEAVLLSTCNRTEFYLETTDHGVESVRSWLINDQKLKEEAMASLFMRKNEAAIHHLFQVACGLDSMVLGEPQVLGQLKDAFRHAESCGAAGKQLKQLFSYTFSVAKNVRTNTEIGANPVSVASAAVSLIGQFLSKLPQNTALLIGAGLTIELVAKQLKRKQIGRLFIANRDLARAKTLATRFGGFALPLSELEGTLPEADILISSTASTTPLVTDEEMKQAIKLRHHKPVVAVDLAVPRDLDRDIAKLQDVYLYTIDDLDKVIVEGQSNRKAAAIDAQRILEVETKRYLTMERSKDTAPLITALRNHGDKLRQEVLIQAQRRLAKGDNVDEVIKYATSALLKKLLHDPSVRLREAGANSDAEFAKVVAELFKLNRNDQS
ncbi:MAG: glutamyl-tRNA reductase [Woeseia sp.]|nr:glutamyl-tRNA reductase [Woeseia sp.]|tara:strand:+ start:238 stop:1500 length:1263 start_codon:yes stop_codon:yes gene_type:complete